MKIYVIFMREKDSVCPTIYRIFSDEKKAYNFMMTNYYDALDYDIEMWIEEYEIDEETV